MDRRSDALAREGALRVTLGWYFSLFGNRQDEYKISGLPNITVTYSQALI